MINDEKVLQIRELMNEIKQISETLELKDKIEFQNETRKLLYETMPEMEVELPCLKCILVPTEKVQANDYNPNKVANPEMKLLKHSIEEDGLTMSIVTYYDKQIDKYIVIDGFHRYSILKDRLKMKYIAVTVIEKDIKDRMASTVRHNRARGVHKVDLQAEMVVDLIKKGWNDTDISEHLGMSFEEVLRLKQVTGIKEVFKNRDFSRTWTVEGAIRENKEVTNG